MYDGGSKFSVFLMWVWNWQELTSWWRTSYLSFVKIHCIIHAFFERKFRFGKIVNGLYNLLLPQNRDLNSKRVLQFPCHMRYTHEKKVENVLHMLWSTVKKQRQTLFPICLKLSTSDTRLVLAPFFFCGLIPFPLPPPPTSIIFLLLLKKINKS